MTSKIDRKLLVACWMTYVGVVSCLFYMNLTPRCVSARFADERSLPPIFSVALLSSPQWLFCTEWSSKWCTALLRFSVASVQVSSSGQVIEPYNIRRQTVYYWQECRRQVRSLSLTISDTRRFISDKSVVVRSGHSALRYQIPDGLLATRVSSLGQVIEPYDITYQTVY